jgi:predicted O-methyltransferase YrrM
LFAVPQLCFGFNKKPQGASIITQIRKVIVQVMKLLHTLDYAGWLWVFNKHGHSHTWSIPTHMSKRERLLLYRLVRRNKKVRIILEVGSYLGASTTVLAAGLIDSRRNGCVHCVDTWKNEAMTEGLRDTWHDFLRNTGRYRTTIKPHRGRSDEIAQTFGESIDFLFIDGDHSYAGCLNDIRSWIGKVRSGGTVVFHDYSWAEGVRTAVEEEVLNGKVVSCAVVDTIFWCVLK